MNNVPMYSMSVEDIGECVTSNFNNPTEYKAKIVGVWNVDTIGIHGFNE